MNSNDCQLSDHELMRRFQMGDHFAFELLVCRWDAPIARLLGRLIGSHAAEDLRQETFLRILKNSAKYKADHHFSTWIFRIAINLARDHHRRKRIRSLILGGAKIQDKGLPPDQNFEFMELSQKTQIALESLEFKFRELLVLKHFNNLTFDEMSQILKIPKSTIKSRMVVALQKLKLELQKLGINQEICR